MFKQFTESQCGRPNPLLELAGHIGQERPPESNLYPPEEQSPFKGPSKGHLNEDEFFARKPVLYSTSQFREPSHLSDLPSDMMVSEFEQAWDRLPKIPARLLPLGDDKVYTRDWFQDNTRVQEYQNLNKTRVQEYQSPSKTWVQEYQESSIPVTADERIFQGALNQPDPMVYIFENVRSPNMASHYIHELVNRGVPVTTESVIVARRSPETYKYLLNMNMWTDQNALEFLRCLYHQGIIPFELFDLIQPPIGEVARIFNNVVHIMDVLKYYPEIPEMYLEIMRSTDNPAICIAMLEKLGLDNLSHNNNFMAITNLVHAPTIRRQANIVKSIYVDKKVEYWLNRLQSSTAPNPMSAGFDLLDSEALFEFLSADPTNVDRYIQWCISRNIAFGSRGGWYHITREYLENRNYCHLDFFFNLIPDYDNKLKLFKQMVKDGVPSYVLRSTNFILPDTMLINGATVPYNPFIDLEIPNVDLLDFFLEYYPHGISVININKEKLTYQLAERLLKTGVNVTRYALTNALSNGNMPVFYLLLSKVGPDVYLPYEEAIENNNLQALKAMLDTRHPSQNMMNLAQGKPAILEYLKHKMQATSIQGYLDINEYLNNDGVVTLANMKTIIDSRIVRCHYDSIQFSFSRSNISRDVFEMGHTIQ